jgi:hypothetical protein
LNLEKETKEIETQFFKIAKTNIEKLSKKLQNWNQLEFGNFTKELNKAIKTSTKKRL